MDSDSTSEIEDDNFETEEDLGNQDSKNYSKAVIWGTDWTAETIVSQLKKGNIDLNPDFQRRDAWDHSKKSKFIESLILGLPVPPIILAERKDRKNSYIVIDGKQRLLTIMQFCAKAEDRNFSQLFLKDLEILETLNDFNYDKLEGIRNSTDYVTQFDNQTIRAVVIRNWPNEKFLYTVFLRLNTGSLKLSPQELRQALHPGQFLSYIGKFSESKNKVWEILKLKKADSRMRDIELIIRYFAFKNFLSTYSDSLKDFLDKACNNINESWERDSNNYIQQLHELENAIEFVTDIFGEKSRFTKFLDGSYTNTFNRTIFDIMVYFFSEPRTRERLRGRGAEIKAAFEKLMTENEAFIASVSGSTKDSEKTQRRYKEFGDILQNL